jgi:hypothetical protein
MHLKEIWVFLRDKAPKTLNDAQEMVRKIEDYMASSDKVDLFGSSRASTSKVEAKKRYEIKRPNIVYDGKAY